MTGTAARPKILEVSRLRKEFRTRQGTLVAVAGVDFAIEESEIYGLVGESGSGKSTVGSMIVGMYPSNGGEILFRGQDIDRPASKRSKELKGKSSSCFRIREDR